MTAEYPVASWVGIPGFGYDPAGSHGREGHPARWIILHGTADPGATAQDIANYFASDPNNGTHFVVGRDGEVIQMVSLGDAAYGNAPVNPAKHDAFWDVLDGDNPNFYTVSIEHCNWGRDQSGTPNNGDPLTPAQQAASFALVKWLCQKLNIPARPADASGGITGHFSLDGVNRVDCPGNYPWSALWAHLAPSPPKGLAQGMLISHPTLETRLDLIYVDASGDVHHRWTINGGLAGLLGDSTTTGNENWGNPGKPFAPLSASATWDAAGNYLNVIAATEDGAIWGQVRHFDAGTTISGTWEQVSPKNAPALALPATPATAEPLAQKLVTGLHGLSTDLANL